MNIENPIVQLKKKYKTNNPFLIADNMGIGVLYENLGTINGYYNTTLRQKFIHINQNLPKHLQQLTAAHELGHAILHPTSNTPFLRECTYFSVDKLEVEANMFAVNLLISDDELENYKNYTVDQIARMFGYHEKLIELKLKSIKDEYMVKMEQIDCFFGYSQ